MGRRYLEYSNITSKKKNRVVYDSSNINEIKDLVKERYENNEEIQSYLKLREEKLLCYKSTLQDPGPIEIRSKPDITPKKNLRKKRVISLSSDLKLDTSSVKMHKDCPLPSSKTKVVETLPTFKHKVHPPALPSFRVDKIKTNHTVREIKQRNIRRSPRGRNIQVSQAKTIKTNKKVVENPGQAATIQASVLGNDKLIINLNDYLTLAKKNVGKFNLKPVGEKSIQKIAMNQNILNSSPSKVLEQNSKRTYLLIPQTKPETNHQSVSESTESKVVSDPQIRPQTNYQPGLKLALQKVTPKADEVTLKKCINLKPHPLFIQKTPILMSPRVVRNSRPIILKAKLPPNQKSSILGDEPIVLNLESEHLKGAMEILSGITETSVTKHVQRINKVEDRISLDTHDKIFPVALKPSDSNDFEHLRIFEEPTNDSDSEMQILGI